MTENERKKIVELTELSKIRANYKARIELIELIRDNIHSIFKDGYIFHFKRNSPEIYEASKVLADSSNSSLQSFLFEVFDINLIYSASFDDEYDLRAQLKQISKGKTVLKNFFTADANLYLLVKEKAEKEKISIVDYLKKNCPGFEFIFTADAIEPTPFKLFMQCVSLIKQGKKPTKSHFEKYAYLQIIKNALSVGLSFDEWISEFPLKFANSKMNKSYLFLSRNKGEKETLERFHKVLSEIKIDSSLKNNTSEVLSVLTEMSLFATNLRINTSQFFSSFGVEIPCIGKDFKNTSDLFEFNLMKKRIKNAELAENPEKRKENDFQNTKQLKEKYKKREEKLWISFVSQKDNYEFSQRIAEIFDPKKEILCDLSKIAEKSKNLSQKQKEFLSKILEKHPSGLFSSIDETLGRSEHNLILEWANSSAMTVPEWIKSAMGCTYINKAYFRALKDLVFVEYFFKLSPNKSIPSNLPTTFARLSKFAKQKTEFANGYDFITEKLQIKPKTFEDIVWLKRDKKLQRLFKKGPVVDLKNKDPELYNEIATAVYTDKAKENGVSSYADYIRFFHDREVVVDKRSEIEYKDNYIEILKKELDKLLGENGSSDGISAGRFGKDGVLISRKISYLSRSTGKSPNEIFEALGHPKLEEHPKSLEANEKYENFENYENDIFSELLLTFPKRTIPAGFSTHPLYFKISNIARMNSESVKSILIRKGFSYVEAEEKIRGRVNTTGIEATNQQNFEEQSFEKENETFLQLLEKNEPNIFERE